jgi:hypothetical protein
MSPIESPPLLLLSESTHGAGNAPAELLLVSLLLLVVWGAYRITSRGRSRG